MEFTFWFLQTFFWMLLLSSPLLFFLSLVIFIMGRVINRIEGWKIGWIGSFYYSFITATTVGYGDFCPVKRRSRVLAIAIGLTGLVMTGIVVAVGIESVKLAMRHVIEDENNSAHIEFFEKQIYKGLERKDRSVE